MTQNLNGKAFVFTGEMQLSREEAIHRVITHGGRVTSAVSGKTNYLVCGEEPGPKKIEKARQLKVEILDESQFLKILSQLKIEDEEFSTNLKAETTVKNACPTQKGGDSSVAKNQDKADQCISILNSCSNHAEMLAKLSSAEKQAPADIRLPPTSKMADVGTIELWTEKYRPKTVADLVGNQSVVQELRKFLNGEHEQRAVLISGSPGVGKTTMAHLICQELGFEVIEFNASDVRSKMQISKKIQDTIDFYSVRHGLRRKVVLMDEIDGMSSDRGGIAELGALIKRSRVRLICICNDRNNPRMRTLAGHCLDLRCRKLLPSQIHPRLQKILALERKHVSDPMLHEIITASHGDIRFCLNALQNICSREKLSLKCTEMLLKKVVMRNIFDLVSETFMRKRVSDKIELFFEDYSFLPLFVFENYLKSSMKNITYIARAADSVSFADIIDRKIHGTTQEWSLLPLYGFYSCVSPTQNRNLRSRIDFPSLLGQRSKANKNKEILKRYGQKKTQNSIIHATSLRLDVFDLDVLLYLNAYKKANIESCLQFLQENRLSKQEMDDVIEVFISGTSHLKELSASVKRQLTSAYKKTLPKQTNLLKEPSEDEKSADSDSMDIY